MLPYWQSYPSLVYKDIYMPIFKFYVLEKFDIFRNLMFQPPIFYTSYNIIYTVYNTKVKQMGGW